MARLNVLLVLPGKDETGPHNRDPQSRMAKARQEARLALALDPDSIDALLALTIIDYRERKLSLAEAEAAFRAVYEKAPNHPNVNLRLAMMLNELGRDREALVYLQKAHELDPFSIYTSRVYLQRLMHARRLQEVEDKVRVDDYKFFEGTYSRLEWALAERDHAAAWQWLDYVRQTVTISPHTVGPKTDPDGENSNRLLSLLDRVITVSETGDPDSDPLLPSDMLAAADEGLILHTYVAMMLGAAGMNEPAFKLANQRIEVDDRYFRQALFRPAFREIRTDPGVMELFEMTTQLDYWLETGFWPDFCNRPQLPYDCEEAALRYRASR